MPLPTIQVKRGSEESPVILTGPNGGVLTDAAACGENISEVSSIQVEYRLVGTFTGPEDSDCDGSVDATISQTFYRADRDFNSPSDPDGGYFQLYRQCCSPLINPLDFSISPTDIDGSVSCGRPAADDCEDTPSGNEMGVVVGFGGSDPHSMILRASPEFVLSCQMINPDTEEPCAADSCGADGGATDTSHVAVDLDDLIGVYVLTETVSDAVNGWSFDVTVTVTIS